MEDQIIVSRTFSGEYLVIDRQDKGALLSKEDWKLVFKAINDLEKHHPKGTIIRLPSWLIEIVPPVGRGVVQPLVESRRPQMTKRR